MIKSGYYKHYKGNIYRVIGYATHSETLEPLVIYEAVYNGKVWARPESMWNDILEYNGEKVKRFTFIRERDTKI